MIKHSTPRTPAKRRPFDAIRRLATDRRGVTAAFTGVSLMMLMGFAGLGTEVGSWYVTKRSMQGAVDAAAFSAAVAGSSSESFAADGTAVAASYGYVSGVHSVTVSINNPPTSGAYAGVSSAYEAVISQPQTQLFSKLFMATPATLSARAVATGGSEPNICILTLSTAQTAGIVVNGGDTINLSNCDIRDNAVGSQSLTMNGTAKISATAVYLGGGDLLNGPAIIDTTQGLFTNAPKGVDKYANKNLPLPTPGLCDFNNFSVNGGTKTLTPGTYCNGMTFNAATITLQAGIYYIDRGSFVVNGNSTVTGTGVTIVLTSSTGSGYGGVTINGSASVTLTPPTTGPSAGFAFFADRNAPLGTTVTLNGGNHFNVTGVLYFPSENVTFNGQGTSTCTELIAQTVTFNGNANLGGDCSGVPGVQNSGNISVKLVE